MARVRRLAGAVSFFVVMTEESRLDVVRWRVGEFVLADFLNLEDMRVFATQLKEAVTVTLLHEFH